VSERLLTLPVTIPVVPKGGSRGAMPEAEDADPRPERVRRTTPLASADAATVVSAAFEQYQRELFSFALHATRDQGHAEDIVQEAFLRLHRSLLDGQQLEDVRAWLFRVSANLVLSRGRRISIVGRWLARLPRSEQHHESPEAAVIGRERTRAVADALGALTPDARTAVLLAGRGFAIREIAESLGRTELATRALLCRSRLRIRTLLEEDEAGPER
jgi:RNA polymerase sigma-70 factor, ECF subfamily